MISTHREFRPRDKEVGIYDMNTIDDDDETCKDRNHNNIGAGGWVRRVRAMVFETTTS